LSKMLTSLGHKVILYCGEGSETEATEQVIVISDQTRKNTYGDYDWTNQFFKHDPKDAAYREFNANTILEISRRKSEKDFLLCTMGNYQQEIANSVGLQVVESGIGYTGIFAKYKVFESYAWMSYIYGLTNQQDGNYYDAVIPNSYDLADFPYSSEFPKQNYYVYLGRLIQRKGLQIALEVTQYLKAPLIIAGQGDLHNVEGRDFSQFKNVKHIGSVPPKERAALLAGAIATFVPTTYIEPFGGVAIESQLEGTPVITTDWGVFPETVVHGKTGYRCRTFDDFVWAAYHAKDLDGEECRRWASENYSIDRVRLMYQKYFENIYDLWDDGWYTIYPNRNELDWLKKVY